jgi:hypothetical protein
MAWEHPRYDAVHFVVALEYVSLIFLSLYCLFRVWRAGNQQKWQKAFHPLLLLGTALRAVFFFLQPFVMEQTISIANRANMFLNYLPSFFFFSDYMIVLFLWAEIYHFRLEVRVNRLRPIFWTLTALMYILVIIIFVLDFTVSKKVYLSSSEPASVFEQVLMTYDASIYFLSSLAFLVYAAGVYFRLGSVPSETRRVLLRRILFIAGMISLCFIARAVLVLYNSWVNLNTSDAWWFDGVYFTLLEVLPLCMMILILHQATPKKKKMYLGELKHPQHQHPPAPTGMGDYADYSSLANTTTN